jgi:glycine dehydrogenase subunit 2
MRAYFAARGELPQRNEMITTIFSHPCDAATPMVAGFKVVTVMPDHNGYPDLEAVKAAVSERTVGCMITNPEDTGIYNPRIDEYVKVIHDAGGLCFTDQANANGILGIARARDAGFDACHFNLHKTFSSPHGCEGPATGAYLVCDELAKYLPVPLVTKAGDKFHLDYDRPESIGKVRGFLGNWMGVIRAYAWIRSLAPTACARWPRSRCSTTTTSTGC